MFLSCGITFSFLLVNLIDAKRLWSSTPVTNYSDIIREAYLLGNGRLGAIPFGVPGDEKIVLNEDSLWSGGPFSADNYTGGNPSEEKYSYLPGIRQWIFQNTTGNVSQLLGDEYNYGSYQVLGNLSVSFNTSPASRTFQRALDLKTGIYAATSNEYTSTIFCSYVDQVCVYQINSTNTLPTISLRIENQLVDQGLTNSTCATGYVRLRGVTQFGPPEGMRYEGVARVIGTSANSTECSSSQPGTLTIQPVNGTRSIAIVVSAGTNFDQSNGNQASNFSFRGNDPAAEVQQVTTAAASKTFDLLASRHLTDYQALTNAFTLELPDPYGSGTVETAKLLANYSSTTGDPFVESLLLDHSRHLLISSSRENSLPANLQGRWSPDLEASWGADYHANINLQMNYWVAEQTGLGAIQEGLWRYMQENWVPRGTETAKLLYGAPGWVTHNEMNIFGHTGMKDTAQWANYPASAAWMMQHIADHFSYSQNTTWLKETGYPLMKGVTEFWLSQLQEDQYWKDGSLVVNSCNSPEHGPTTFACTHYQQLLHQLFANMVLLGPLASELDSQFLSNVSSSLGRLDKGFYTTSWGGIREWKLPDPEDTEVYDFQNDTHRHLSNLWGWYPGISLSSPSSAFLGGYSNATIQSAIATELYSRGIGNGPDPGAGLVNAGWEKVWRSACWARLNNTDRAYFELKYAVEQNFVGNGLSMYDGKSTPFQIDANFGLGGAMLAMLIVDIEEPGIDADGKSTVVLGPAVPEAWGGGSVKGLRLRGGGSVDFGWDLKGVVTSVSAAHADGIRFVNKEGKEVGG